MGTPITRALLTPLLSLPLLGQHDAQGPKADIVVHLDQPTHRISPLLYGVFFEEINHAGEGGLWAQLLRNPTFEEPGTETDPLPGWSTIPKQAGPDSSLLLPGSKAKLTASTDMPAHSSTPRHARVEVSVNAALVNRGHFGVPIRKGEEYEFSAMVRRADGSDGQPLSFSVQVRDEQGAVVLADDWSPSSSKERRYPPRLGSEWQEVVFRSIATGTTSAGELQILLSGDALWGLDNVTLRPTKTWQGHGLRQDLGELLAALHPAFVRFPGGCYVEGGDHLADAFRWQKTLGPLAMRPGHRNTVWNYWTTTGLGFHEYLQLCEDLHAAPMYVANCGLSHRDTVPMDQLQPWIDEALAAIEYANGDATAKWGAARAANGHPAPFGLRFLEIGNENGMAASFGFGGTRPVYAERYEAFRKAIAAAHPEVTTIADIRVDAPMQMVDDHFYQSSAWFWQNADRYAQPKAGDPPIYVGEYAVTWRPGATGNLRAALGEAAFLLGLQRAGPHVAMASYAPLFVHVQDRKWNPDLIQFDGLRSCGTPSYHVQSLLSGNRPDENLKCEWPDSRAAAGRGGVGLGTWQTQAEFRDVAVEVDGKVVYQSDFAKEAAGWRAEAGQWSVADGCYRQSEMGDMRWAWLDVPQLRDVGDCVVRCKARKIAGREGFLVMFHTRGADEWSWWNVGGWGNREHAIERTTDGSKLGVGPHARGNVETGRWYDVRIECTGHRIRTFLDDAQVQDVVDQGVPDFAVAAGRCADGTLVLEAVNGSNSVREYSVQLAGAPARQRKATITVLTAPSLDAENTLDQPRTVVPAVETRELSADRFTHTFAPRSVTVLRLPGK